jgi:hypothetical protein
VVAGDEPAVDVPAADANGAKPPRRTTRKPAAAKSDASAAEAAEGLDNPAPVEAAEPVAAAPARRSRKAAAVVAEGTE